MPGRFPYKKRYKYPHMIGEETLIWDRFIVEYPDYFETVDYDWRVGKGVELQDDWDPATKRMATMLTQKRIDVLGWMDDQPTIVEVKKRVGLSAMGQVIGYKTLFTNEFPNIKDPKLLIITESIDADDSLVLKNNHIPFIVV